MGCLRHGPFVSMPVRRMCCALEGQLQSIPECIESIVSSTPASARWQDFSSTSIVPYSRCRSVMCSLHVGAQLWLSRTDVFQYVCSVLWCERGSGLLHVTGVHP